MRSSSVVSSFLLCACVVLCGTSLLGVNAAVSQVNLMTSVSCTSIPTVQGVVPTNGTCVALNSGGSVSVVNSVNGSYALSFYGDSACGSFLSVVNMKLDVCGYAAPLGASAAWLTAYEGYRCNINFWNNPSCQDSPVSTTNGLVGNNGGCSSTGNITYDLMINTVSERYYFNLNCNGGGWYATSGDCVSITGYNSADISCAFPTSTTPTLFDHKKTIKQSNPHANKITNKVLKNKSATHKNKHAAKKH